MKKRWIILMIAGSLTCSVCGCGNRTQEEPGNTVTPIIVEDITGQDMNFPNAGGGETDTDQASVNSTLPFSDLKYLEFWFASGAGGWATRLSIRPDGSFAGLYMDGDIGTTYQCTFNGQFSQPEKVNDYTYSMRILSMTYKEEPGTSETKDDILYQYTTPYGLDEAETLFIYLPGAPLAELPEGYRSWVGYYYLENTTDTELPYYGLYNEAEAEGFSSYALADSLKNNISYIEDQAALIEDSMQHDASLSQGDLNVKSAELYELWDSMLNILWDDLKRAVDSETMRTLTDEQLTWISEKEQAVEAAGAEAEGGSLEPLLRNTKAAELTKTRVYELLSILDER